MLTEKSRYLSLLIGVVLSGCAESAQLRVDRIDSITAIMQFNWGPLIKEVDSISEMKRFCFPFMPEIVESKDIQLPGQYRFQKKVKFRCAASMEMFTLPDPLPEPAR